MSEPKATRGKPPPEETRQQTRVDVRHPKQSPFVTDIKAVKREHKVDGNMVLLANGDNWDAKIFKRTSITDAEGGNFDTSIAHKNIHTGVTTTLNFFTNGVAGKVASLNIEAGLIVLVSVQV